MKRQIILSVFLTSMLLLACDKPIDQCTEHIEAGRTAVVTAADGTRSLVAADADGNITFDCESRLSIF
jgi:hypothetical protein